MFPRAKCHFPLCPWWGKYHVHIDGEDEAVCAKHLSQAVRVGLLDHDNVWVSAA